MNYINTSDMAAKVDLSQYQQVEEESAVMWLEKAQSGPTTLEEIQDALEEFIRLFKAGIASNAEILTLARAYPDTFEYVKAASELENQEPIVIGGPASVELVDREGHLITTAALDRAFKKFMGNIRTRNAMVLHSDVQVGWALPAYITKGGLIFKAGTGEGGLFFICELRDDTAIAKKVAEQIHSGQLKSYSIAGSATKTQNMTKGLTPYLQVDDMELAEVTVCEKGVNQGASFELLKAEVPQTGKVDKDQCGYRDATPPETALGINCGHCKYFNSEDKTCDVVVGDILPGDYCKLFEPCEEPEPQTKKVIIMHSEDTGKISWNDTFNYWLRKEKKDPLASGESFVTLHNEEGRQQEHEQLLREYGFPLEMDAEDARYTPVVEVETDEDGIPIHNKPPWVVNEAGEALGDRLDVTNDKAKAKNGVQSSGEKATAQKMFMDFMKATGMDVEKNPRRSGGNRQRGIGAPPPGTKIPVHDRKAGNPANTDASKLAQVQRETGMTFGGESNLPSHEQNVGEGRANMLTAVTRPKGEEAPMEKGVGDRLKRMFGRGESSPPSKETSGVQIPEQYKTRAAVAASNQGVGDPYVVPQSRVVDRGVPPDFGPEHTPEFFDIGSIRRAGVTPYNIKDKDRQNRMELNRGPLEFKDRDKMAAWDKKYPDMHTEQKSITKLIKFLGA